MRNMDPGFAGVRFPGDTYNNLTERKAYKTMVAEYASQIDEIFPWHLLDELDAGAKPILLDLRSPHEHDAVYVEDSVNVPRGILEMGVNYGYEETIAELVGARNRRIGIQNG